MTGFSDTLGVLLAGGQARRMGGGDKCLTALKGRPLLSYVIDRARPQAATLILNAGGDPARFAAFGLPVVPDVVPGFAGPLAGVLTGMEWARQNHPEAAFIASFATDTPFLPADFVIRCRAAMAVSGAPIAFAASAGRTHPVFGVFAVSLADDLRHALTVEDIHKIDRWTARHETAIASFDNDGDVDPFFNINTPDDLCFAQGLLGVETDDA